MSVHGNNHLYKLNVAEIEYKCKFTTEKCFYYGKPKTRIKKKKT